MDSTLFFAAQPLPQPSLLAQRLRIALPGFCHIDWVERTGSTNADLLELTRREDQPARPWLLGSHLQEHGRGRAGRTWQNRASANLMFSCAFDVFLPPRLLASISPLVGVATCEALRSQLTPANRPLLSLKWPNDLQWKFSKLAGILVEATRSGAARGSPDHHVVVVGMGLNLQDARALSTSLNRAVADWAEIASCDEVARGVDAPDLVLSIVRAWTDALSRLVREGLAGLPARYAAVDHLLGQHLDVVDDGNILYSGIACGVNEQGQLLVNTSGGMTPVSVGEISVRPWPVEGSQNGMAS